MESKYACWSLNRLKEELRNRKARISGRKHELVDRLEAYDRNHNFRDVVMEVEHVMSLPAPETYKDLNSDTKVTAVSFEEANSYLLPLEKAISEKSNKLADAKFIKYVRWSKTVDQCFFKAECRAEMKKCVSYLIDVQCDKDGKVVECQCECAAGMGPTAHCKHICSVLYILGKFMDTKTILTEATCTEKLQSFHHVKRKTSSPVKAHNLSLYTKDSISFDPRPTKYRNQVGYNDYVRNLCINYSSSAIASIPLMQLYEPANVYALEHDHDYLFTTQSELFLETIYQPSNDVERITRGQSQNPVWLEERTVRLTASNFGRICKATDRTDKMKLATSFTQRHKINSSSIKHGRRYEQVAIKDYEDLQNATVFSCGMFVDEMRPYLGASPDGVIDDDTILEVKCPKTAYNKVINHVSVPYLKPAGDTLCLAQTHDYYYQIQGQLAISNRQLCHFVVWTGSDIKIIEIPRNQKFITDMFEKLHQFYLSFFKDAVLAQYFYKNYYAYKFSE